MPQPGDGVFEGQDDALPYFQIAGVQGGRARGIGQQSVQVVPEVGLETAHLRSVECGKVSSQIPIHVSTTRPSYPLLRTWPGRCAVGSWFSMTGRPLTKTWGMPSGG